MVAGLGAIIQGVANLGVSGVQIYQALDDVKKLDREFRFQKELILQAAREQNFIIGREFDRQVSAGRASAGAAGYSSGAVAGVEDANRRLTIQQQELVIAGANREILQLNRRKRNQQSALRRQAFLSGVQAISGGAQSTASGLSALSAQGLV